MKYLQEIRFNDVNQCLFIDIETVSLFKELPEDSPYFDSWEYKCRNDENIKTIDDVKEAYAKKAPLYPTFGKIAVISMGYVQDGVLNMKEYKGEEKDILTELFSDLEKFAGFGKKFLVGFSLIGFDIPFVHFRAIANGITPHPYFDVAGLAPWNVKHLIDMQKMLEGTGFAKMSLVNACVALDLPSPKTNMSGGEVNEVFWSKKKDRIDKIAQYCSLDVLATANIFCKYLQAPILTMNKKEKEEKVKELPILTKMSKGIKPTDADIKGYKSRRKKTESKNTELIEQTIKRTGQDVSVLNS